MEILQNFVAFLECINFNKIWNDAFIGGLQISNVFIQMTLCYVLIQHFLLTAVHLCFEFLNDSFILEW